MLLDTVHIVTLFYCFSQVSAPGEDTATHGRRLLAALLADLARRYVDWRRRTVIRQWVKPYFYQVILCISRVKVDNNVGRSQGESYQR